MVATNVYEMFMDEQLDKIIRCSPFSRIRGKQSSWKVHWATEYHERDVLFTMVKAGTTLVSVQMISPFKDEYFFQFTLMNFPHREYTSLYHEHDDHPTQIRFFILLTKSDVI